MRGCRSVGGTATVLGRTLMAAQVGDQRLRDIARTGGAADALVWILHKVKHIDEAVQVVDDELVRPAYNGGLGWTAGQPFRKEWALR